MLTTATDFYTRLTTVVLACTLLLGATANLFGQDEPSPTKWSDAQGRELEAEFVRMTDETVVLRLIKDGREVPVPLASLSLQSHLQAVKLANPEAFSKPIPKAEVKPEFEPVELPELNLSVAEMLKSPFPPNVKIDQYFDILKREYAAGNFFVDWHGLPPKIQTDIEDVIVKAVEVIGPTTITQVQILLRDLNTVVQDKQEYLFANPQIAAQPEVVGELKKHWPFISGFVAALTKTEHWQPDNFQKGKVVPWLAGFTASMAPHIVAGLDLAKASLPPGAAFPDPANTQFTVLSQTADSAEVEITRGPGLPTEKLKFQKVGNIWINPKAMNELRKQLDAAQAQLAKGPGPEVALVRTTLGAVIAAVGGLARANSQEEFDFAVQNLADMAQGLMQSIPGAAAGGPAAGAPAGGPPGGGRRRSPGAGVSEPG